MIDRRRRGNSRVALVCIEVEVSVDVGLLLPVQVVPDQSSAPKPTGTPVANDENRWYPSIPAVLEDERGSAGEVGTVVMLELLSRYRANGTISVRCYLGLLLLVRLYRLRGEWHPYATCTRRPTVRMIRLRVALDRLYADTNGPRRFYAPFVHLQ
jgi:hypothetical protein